MPLVNGKWIEPRYPRDSVYDVLSILGIVFGVPAVFVLIFQGIKWVGILLPQHTMGEIIGMIVAILILLIMFSSIVYAIWSGILNWWDGLLDYDVMPKSTNIVSNTNNTSYIAPKKPSVYKWNRNTETAEIPAGLVAGDRTQPPQAQFFGRLDGLPVEFTGLYEEKYLNMWEKKYWDKQKAKDPALAATSESVNPQPGLEHIETTTKISKW